MKEELLLYGATGYTGKLIIEALLAQKIKPVLAGRNDAALRLLGEKYSLDTITFTLDDPHAIKPHLENIKVVLNAAGPFIYTYANMLKACLETGTHYLDITGEYQVFEGCAAKNEEAINAKIMVLPGAGFDVVPSDCLAANLKERLPDALFLNLAFVSVNSTISRGTAKTALENIGNGAIIRKDGILKKITPGSDTRYINFGSLQAYATVISWGDISTAYYSTKIPNIKVYNVLPEKLIKKMRLLNLFSWLLQLRPIKNYLIKKIDERKAGPDYEQRQNGFCLLWGCLENKAGQRVEMRLRTPEAYLLTSLTAAIIAKKVLSNQYKVGFQTPSTAYGKDLILEIQDCKFI
ncbi:MAG: saccharopine dehydrogenase NADP-binding domain-containing protein [Chitinophagales bacterium]|nr:saccharopine dehydrogenase NADP-binding domain-containing protein [Chitinophagales bacterium]MDW8274405.1 saccharopine dehydrogenase NADP-binding domain-containing protein [Chitinophagales bacterium]